MGSWEPMIPIEEKTELRWTQMKVYFPLARAKKLIPFVGDHLNPSFFERRTAKIEEYPSSAHGKAATSIKSTSSVTDQGPRSIVASGGMELPTPQKWLFGVRQTCWIGQKSSLRLTAQRHQAENRTASVQKNTFSRDRLQFTLSEIEGGMQ
jgi:hypothetical protein